MPKSGQCVRHTDGKIDRHSDSDRCTTASLQSQALEFHESHSQLRAQEIYSMKVRLPCKLRSLPVQSEGHSVVNVACAQTLTLLYGIATTRKRAYRLCSSTRALTYATAISTTVIDGVANGVSPQKTVARTGSSEARNCDQGRVASEADPAWRSCSEPEPESRLSSDGHIHRALSISRCSYIDSPGLNTVARRRSLCDYCCAHVLLVSVYPTPDSATRHLPL